MEIIGGLNESVGRVGPKGTGFGCDCNGTMGLPWGHDDHHDKPKIIFFPIE